MSRAGVVGIAIVMFFAGAYAAPLLRADGQRERGEEPVASRALLPETPIRGRVVRTPGSEDCEVLDVVQEWVQCKEGHSTRPMWRNLYNGASYAVLPTRKE